MFTCYHMIPYDSFSSWPRRSTWLKVSYRIVLCFLLSYINVFEVNYLGMIINKTLTITFCKFMKKLLSPNLLECLSKNRAFNFLLTIIFFYVFIFMFFIILLLLRHIFCFFSCYRIDPTKWKFVSSI